MRAMIVAAGRGTRLRPLTQLRPKPALPVAGLPLLAYPLALLAAAGVREVVINLHHLPEELAAAARACCPSGLELHFSEEPELLHTGGAIRRVADFLRQSDPCLVLGGDMIVDLDIDDLLARHRASGRAATLVLRDDPRIAHFGSIGVDSAGRVRRVGSRMDLGEEQARGLYTWVNVFSARLLDTFPQRDAFNHLDDWLSPLARERPGEVGAEVLSADACLWEPVGTPLEYLEANFARPALSYLDPEAAARKAGARFGSDWVAGAGAHIGADVRLQRVVIWEGERVAAGTRAREGVFAGGSFHPCSPAAALGRPL